MAFAGINYWAVLAAAVAAWIAGAVYYGVLGKPWVASLEKTEAEIKAKQGTPSFYIPFVLSFLAELLMAWSLAGVIGHLGVGQVTIRNGLLSGIFVWLGFILTTMLVNNSFGGRKPMLTIIDAGHWLLVLVIMGVVIGVMGVG